MSKWYSLGTKLNEEEHKQFHQYLEGYNETNNTSYTSYTPNKLLRVIIQELVKKYEV